MKKQHLEKIVVEVLKDMDRYSEEAVLAIMMIIAHESKRGEFLFQMGGPALGLIQMEPKTHASIWRHSDSIEENAKLLGLQRDARQLYKSIEYSVFMARQYLLMDTAPIPTDPIELSKYLKQYWNTNLGRARDLSYYEDYMMW